MGVGVSAIVLRRLYEVLAQDRLLDEHQLVGLELLDGTLAIGLCTRVKVDADADVLPDCVL